MANGKVIEAKVWVNKVTGRRVSSRGACPWTRDAERSEWELKTVGFTIQHPDGTTGIGQVPFATAELAQAWVDRNPNFPGMSQG